MAAVVPIGINQAFVWELQDASTMVASILTETQTRYFPNTKHYYDIVTGGIQASPGIIF